MVCCDLKLDAESVAWLEKYLQDFKGTVVAITHDRYFLENSCSWILELDRGVGIPYEGNYSGWLEKKQARLIQEKRQDSRLKKTLDHELEWVRSSPQARQAKSKARLTRYEELLNTPAREVATSLSIYIPPGPRLGDLVVNADKISKSFGERTLFKDVSFSIPAGAIVGIVGPNGAGKSTLMKLIQGIEQPSGGVIEVGKTVQLAAVSQDREDQLSTQTSVYDEISQGQDTLLLGTHEVNSRAYCTWFGFRGGDQQKKVGVLSGGERNRCQLAKIVRSGANVLILDEPTNDLDVDTIRSLEEALLDFAGCVLVVSHDRFFLDRICTHIVAFEGDGQVFFFQGNYNEYAKYRQDVLGTSAKAAAKSSPFAKIA